MRSIKLGSDLFVLGDEFVWSGGDADAVEILNNDTQTLLKSYGSAHGDARAYVYETILQRYPIFKKAVNDEKIISDKNVLY